MGSVSDRGQSRHGESANVAFFLGGCATGKAPEGQQHSGFLKDYSQLKQEKDAAGDPVLRYISPQLSSGNYRQIMIDPVDFYPKPEPSDNVDAATLNEIKTYMDQQLRKKIGERVPVVDKPGPGVVRMRAAITGVAEERAGLKPYQYIPVALLVVAAKEATGTRAKDAAVQVEVELLDSVSGKSLGAAVRRGTGESVKGGEGSKLTLAHVKPLLGQMGSGRRGFHSFESAPALAAITDFGSSTLAGRWRHPH